MTSNPSDQITAILHQIQTCDDGAASAVDLRLMIFFALWTVIGAAACLVWGERQRRIGKDEGWSASEVTRLTTEANELANSINSKTS